MVVITIDGPAATGKSTIARALACHFNFFYLSSGFLYRSFSYFLKLNNINYMNESEVVAKLNNCVIKYQNTDDRYALLTLCGIPVDLFSLDTQEIGVIASSVSAFMPVRKHFLHIQREIVKRENRIVLEGRDAGSVIWPQADVKIFLTASVEERARRLCERQKSLDYDSCLHHVRLRDDRDSKRIHAPLVVPQGAVVIDSTAMTIDEAYEYIKKMVDKIIST